jgi:hypothetical protein
MNPLLSPATLNQLVSFKSVGLPYNPDIFINDQPYARQEIIDRLLNLQNEGLGFTLTSGFGKGHVSPEHLKYGTAVDMTPTGETTYEDLQNALTKQGLQYLKHGDPNGGIHGMHLHVSPSKELIAQYNPKEILEKKPPQMAQNVKGIDVDMNNQGYMGNLPQLGYENNPEALNGLLNEFLPAIEAASQINPDSPTPEADLLAILGEPLYPRQTPQGGYMIDGGISQKQQMQPNKMSGQQLLQQQMQRQQSPQFMQKLIPQQQMVNNQMSGQQLLQQQMQNPQGQMTGAAAKKKDGYNFPDRLSLALMLAGQGIAAAGGKGGVNGVPALMELQKREKGLSDKDKKNALSNLEFPTLLRLLNDPNTSPRDRKLIEQRLQQMSRDPQFHQQYTQAGETGKLEATTSNLGMRAQALKVLGENGLPITEENIQMILGGQPQITSPVQPTGVQKPLQQTPQGSQTPSTSNPYIQGSKQYTDWEKTQKEDQKNKEQKIKELKSIQTDNDIAMEAINDLESKITPLTTGFIGGTTKNIAGSPAYDLSQLIDTVVSKISIDKMMEMKRASKTGATGFGQLNQNELDLLKASVRSLKQSQSTEQFKSNLQKVKKHFMKVQKAIQDEMGGGQLNDNDPLGLF